MYWSAMTTRFCVGMFTPAIRATSVSRRYGAARSCRGRPPPRPRTIRLKRTRTSPRRFSAPDPIACVPSRESGGLVTRVSAPVNRPERTVGHGQIYPRSSFDLVQDGADFAGHVVDGAHAVHRPQRALAVVVADQRRRLAVVDHQPVRHRFRGVVVAPRERRSLAHVADAADLRPAKAIMVALPAGGAAEAADDALDDAPVVDLELDHGVELLLLALQHRVERVGLRQVARKSIEDDALLAIGLVDALADHTHHDGV